MRELSNAGRLAAWGSAALSGAVSPDDAAEAVRAAHDAAHRMHGLPEEQAQVNLPYALARLRSMGVTGLRLVLPRPGDAAGLPGPPGFNEAAIGLGEAVLTVGGPSLGLLEQARGTWSVDRVTPDPRTPLSLAGAARELTSAVRQAAEVLTHLDVARWDPAAAEVLSRRSRSVRPALPASAGPQAESVLHQALRVSAMVELAGAGDGAAVSAVEMGTRADALRALDRAVRHALEASCSAPLR